VVIAGVSATAEPQAVWAPAGRLRVGCLLWSSYLHETQHIVA
jgi:hypothetical protein